MPFIFHRAILVTSVVRYARKVTLVLIVSMISFSIYGVLISSPRLIAIDSPDISIGLQVILFFPIHLLTYEIKRKCSDGAFLALSQRLLNLRKLLVCQMYFCLNQ